MTFYLSQLETAIAVINGTLASAGQVLDNPYIAEHTITVKDALDNAEGEAKRGAFGAMVREIAGAIDRLDAFATFSELFSVDPGVANRSDYGLVEGILRDGIKDARKAIAASIKIEAKDVPRLFSMIPFEVGEEDPDDEISAEIDALRDMAAGIPERIASSLASIAAILTVVVQEDTDAIRTTGV